MSDRQRIVALKYQIRPADDVMFNDFFAPLSDSQEPFEVRIDPTGMATFTLKQPMTDLDAAKRLADEYLRSWEIHAALEGGYPVISYRFEGAEVAEDQGDEPGVKTAKVFIVADATVAVDAVVVHVLRAYPRLPSSFLASPDVGTLWERYKGYRRGREPLRAMGYACFTFLKAQAGGVSNAGRLFGVDPRVLKKLSELVSTTGTDKTARKLPARPATSAEEVWIEAAVRALIRRVGEHAYDPSTLWPRMTMADLPPLT
jgi:hypothetical protein